MKKRSFGHVVPGMLLIAACLSPVAARGVAAEPLEFLEAYAVLRLPGAKAWVKKVQAKCGVTINEAATAVILAEAELNAEMCGFRLGSRHKFAKRQFIDRSKPHRAYKYAKNTPKFPLGANRNGHCENVLREDRLQGSHFFEHPDRPESMR